MYTSEGYISIDLEAELLEFERIIRQKKAKIENLFYDKINELDKELREKRVKILCEALKAAAGIDSGTADYTSEIKTLNSTTKMKIYNADRMLESAIRKEIEDMTLMIQAKTKHLRALLSLTRWAVKKVERRLSLEAALKLVLADKHVTIERKERKSKRTYKTIDLRLICDLLMAGKIK